MKFLRITLLLAALSLLSKILGLLRIVVFSNRLGPGREFDIYVAAFRLPDFIFNLLILGTLSVAFIPVFIEYLSRSKQESAKISSTIFNFTFLVMAALAGAGILLADHLVGLIVPGFASADRAETARLTRILMLSPLFFGLSSVLTSVLHSFKKFFLAAVAPLIYNLSIIGGVLYLYPRFGIPGIAWAVVCGAALHFALQFPKAYLLGLRPFAYFDLHHEGVKKIAKLFLPRLFGMDLGQISLLLASIFGSFFASGTLSVMYIAYDLEMVPVGIFAISFAIAAFPPLSEFASARDFTGFKKFFSQTAVQILFVIIPLSVLMLLLRAQIVRLIPGALQGTKFTFEDTRLAAETLGFFALSLFAQALVPLLARCFYALQNTIIPVISGLAAGVVNIVLVYFLRHVERPFIFALGFSAAAVIQMVILLVILHRRLSGLDDEFLLLRLVKISVAAVLMGIATYLTLYIVAPLVDMRTYFGILIQTISALAVAVITYLGAGLLIGLPETRGLVAIAKTWLFKFTRPVTTALVDMFTDVK